MMLKFFNLILLNFHIHQLYLAYVAHYFQLSKIVIGGYLTHQTPQKQACLSKLMIKTAWQVIEFLAKSKLVETLDRNKWNYKWLIQVPSGDI